MHENFSISMRFLCVFITFNCLSRCIFLSPSYLELVLLVFGALVKGPVVSEPPDVIELIEAFDVVRHSISLQHILTFRDGRHGVDLQVWRQRKLREVQWRSDKRKH